MRECAGHTAKFVCAVFEMLLDTIVASEKSEFVLMGRGRGMFLVLPLV